MLFLSKSLPQKLSRSNMSLYSFSWIFTILDSLQFACCLVSQSIYLMSHASLSNIHSDACNKLVIARQRGLHARYRHCCDIKPEYLACSLRWHTITMHIYIFRSSSNTLQGTSLLYNWPPSCAYYLVFQYYPLNITISVVPIWNIADVPITITYYIRWVTDFLLFRTFSAHWYAKFSQYCC